jgi:hypothetical protein
LGTRRFATECARRLNKFPFSQGQNLAAHQPGVAGPADQAKRQDDMIQPRTQHGGERDGQQNTGKRHEDIDQAHEQLVDPAAEVSR